MNTKNIFRTIWRSAGAAALLLSATAFTSCSDDETEGGGTPYFRLENVVVSSKAVSNYNELGFDVASTAVDPLLPDNELIRYDIRSNCDWTAECNSEDAEWLEIYPRTGKADGKVRFRLTDNDATTPRSATVVFRYGNGLQTEATLAVNQFANDPYIKFYVDGADTTNVFGGRFAQHYDIRVASNVDPFYALPKLDWATFTETGNGTFTLDLTDYPETPAALERSLNIDFKGSGEYASVTNTLEVVQTIKPEITVTGSALEAEGLPPFAASKPDPVTLTVKCNWDWTITQNEADDWFSVVPMSGEAGKEYTVKITVQNNTSDTRSAVIAIVSEEVMGTRAETRLEIMQESGGGGGLPMTGLDNPVEWFFNGAEGTDYTVPTQQFVEENNLRPASGNGSISYFHTYKEQTGTDDPDCKRFIGGTGQPYVTGAWPGDYWLFDVPVKNFKTGTKVKISFVSRISGTGQKYWTLEYKSSTSTSWKAAGELQTATFNGQTISYTHQLPTSTPNLGIEATVTFSRPIPDGSVQFRFICAANCTGGNAALENPNGGTMRLASSVETGYRDSPIIQVVE